MLNLPEFPLHHATPILCPHCDNFLVYLLRSLGYYICGGCCMLLWEVDAPQGKQALEELVEE